MKYSFRADVKIYSKKNKYEIHFAKHFWSQIAGIVSAMKNAYKRANKPLSLYWIDTRPEVKQAEQLLAWAAKRAIPAPIRGPVMLCIRTGQRNDLDNLCGSIFDALELSGRIANDKQIIRAEIERVPDFKGLEIAIIEWEPKEAA